MKLKTIKGLNFFQIIIIIIIGFALFYGYMMYQFYNTVDDLRSNIRAKNTDISSNSLNELEEDTIEINLEYIGMMCPCPQWATPENIELYHKSIETNHPIPLDSLFIEVIPSHDSIPNLHELEGDSIQTIFKFTGQYFKEKRQWTAEDGRRFNNHVFQYYKFEPVFKQKKLKKTTF